MAKQQLIVGYDTALEFWRETRATSSELQELEGEGRTYGRLPQTVTTIARRTIELLGVEAPIDVVAPSSSARVKNPLVSPHSFAAPMPPRHLFRIDEDVAICRMPVVFVQLAYEASLIDLARIAYEMTGTYGFGTTGELVKDLRPLVDLGELRGYATSGRALRVRGATRACRALDLVVPNSNSPRETDVAIALMTPRSMGGFALPGFVMNQPIKLSEHLGAIVGSDVLTPDFYWPDGKVIMEYESDQFHTSLTAIGRDERRRRAFESDGYHVVRLMNDVLATNDALNSFMTQLAKTLGLRRRPASEAMLAKRRELRQELFGPVSSEVADWERGHPYEGIVV